MRLTKNLYIILLTVLIPVAGLFTGCTKNTYDFNTFASNQWDPEFATALVTGSVGINNINLTDSNSYLQVASDSSMSFVWYGNITKFYTSDFIPGLASSPSVFTRSLSPAEQAALGVAPTNSTYTITGLQVANLSTEKSSQINIDTIILKTGTISFNIQNSFSDPGVVTITVPGIKEAGVPFSRVVNIKASASASVSYDLSNLNIDMSNGGTTYNYLELDYSIAFTKVSSSTLGSISFTTQINNPSLKTLYGDVLQQNFFTAEVRTIPLNIFKNVQQNATLSLSDANVKLLFKNSFGVPMNFALTQLKGTDASNDTFHLNVGGISPTPFYIHGASSLGMVAYDTLSLNKNNPASGSGGLNLPQFLSSLPTSFYPKFTAITNPGPSTTKHYNFIQDTSSGTIDAQIQIPLDVKINTYLTKDTFDYNIGSVQNIQSLTLRTYFNNGFPIGINGSLAFKDANYNTIFTLGSTQIPLLAPAVTDPNTGLVTTKTPTTTDFALDSSEVANLGNVKKVIFTGTVSSPGNGSQYAKIYSNYTIDIKIGAKAKLKSN